MATMDCCSARQKSGEPGLGEGSWGRGWSWPFAAQSSAPPLAPPDDPGASGADASRAFQSHIQRARRSALERERSALQEKHAREVLAARQKSNVVAPWGGSRGLELWLGPRSGCLGSV